MGRPIWLWYLFLLCLESVIVEDQIVFARKSMREANRFESGKGFFSGHAESSRYLSVSTGRTTIAEKYGHYERDLIEESGPPFESERNIRNAITNRRGKSFEVNESSDRQRRNERRTMRTAQKPQLYYPADETDSNPFVHRITMDDRFNRKKQKKLNIHSGRKKKPNDLRDQIGKMVHYHKQLRVQRTIENSIEDDSDGGDPFGFHSAISKSHHSGSQFERPNGYRQVKPNDFSLKSAKKQENTSKRRAGKKSRFRKEQRISKRNGGLPGRMSLNVKVGNNGTKTVEGKVNLGRGSKVKNKRDARKISNTKTPQVAVVSLGTLKLKRTKWNAPNSTQSNGVEENKTKHRQKLDKSVMNSGQLEDIFDDKEDPFANGTALSNSSKRVEFWSETRNASENVRHVASADQNEGKQMATTSSDQKNASDIFVEHYAMQLKDGMQPSWTNNKLEDNMASLRQVSVAKDGHSQRKSTLSERNHARPTRRPSDLSNLSTSSMLRDYEADTEEKAKEKISVRRKEVKPKKLRKFLEEKLMKSNGQRRQQKSVRMLKSLQEYDHSRKSANGNETNGVDESTSVESELRNDELSSNEAVVLPVIREQTLGSNVIRSVDEKGTTGSSNEYAILMIVPVSKDCIDEANPTNAISNPSVNLQNVTPSCSPSKSNRNHTSCTESSYRINLPLTLGGDQSKITTAEDSIIKLSSSKNLSLKPRLSSDQQRVVIPLTNCSAAPELLVVERRRPLNQENFQTTGDLSSESKVIDKVLRPNKYMTNANTSGVKNSNRILSGMSQNQRRTLKGKPIPSSIAVVARKKADSATGKLNGESSFDEGVDVENHGKPSPKDGTHIIEVDDLSDELRKLKFSTAQQKMPSIRPNPPKYETVDDRLFNLANGNPIPTFIGYTGNPTMKKKLGHLKKVDNNVKKISEEQISTRKDVDHRTVLNNVRGQLENRENDNYTPALRRVSLKSGKPKAAQKVAFSRKPKPKYVSGTAMVDGVANALKALQEVGDDDDSSMGRKAEEYMEKDHSTEYKAVTPAGGRVNYATTRKWEPFTFNCENEVDERGDICGGWAEAGLCLAHRPTMFLFCRKTCLCDGPKDKISHS